MQKAILIVIAVVAVLVIGWALLRTGDDLPEPMPAPAEAPVEPEVTEPEPTDPTPVETPAEVAAPEPAPAPEPEQPLPPLAESDPFVRERLEPMDLPEPWLEQGDYVRRLATLAENAARGELPRRQLAFLAPREPFAVVRENDRIFIDPASYDRYDFYVNEVVSVEPSRLATLLDTLNPLVETALAEIGVDAPSGEVFAAAVREVLAVPVLEGRVEVVQPNVMYQYADPELESLSPLQKQVLRMGPENVQRLQSYVRRVAEEMDLPLRGA
jgi:hypothetical protein